MAGIMSNNNDREQKKKFNLKKYHSRKYKLQLLIKKKNNNNDHLTQVTITIQKQIKSREKNTTKIVSVHVKYF